MTKTVLIVGAGPAAAGAALACASHPGVEVTVLDVGEQLEEKHEHARRRLAATAPANWERDDLALVGVQPTASSIKGPPQKRAYGSDFPFRDVGQLAPTVPLDGANDAVVSGAYGGFSTAWGAQAMPFTRPTFRDWPIDADEMFRHYAAVLSAIPYAAEDDDLARLFPILAPAQSLPPLSERTVAVLARFARHRSRLLGNGITVGRARLAFDASSCVRCGLCMTGCPYRLIYSADQTIDRLRADAGVAYRPGLLAIRLEEDAGRPAVIARELASGRLQRFEADHVLLACGGFGTTRLVAGSLGLYGRGIALQESLQFILPFFSAAPTGDPRSQPDFTLNQFNLVVELDDVGLDVAQLHFYTYNAAFVDQLPRLFRTPRLARHALRRLSVAFGYLPSWASPTLRATVYPPTRPDTLPTLEISGEMGRPLRNAMLRTVLRRVAAASPFLDLWPVLPALIVSAPAKSYHWGGSFPHSRLHQGDLCSDPLGRVGPWQHIHLVDGSVFPTVPATTFTLGVMANAHRIAASVLGQG